MLVLERNIYTLYISEKEDGTARDLPWFIYTKQIHGNWLYIADRTTTNINDEYDGIISKTTEIKTWVILADCNGIVMMGNEWYGVVHAGRRWLKNGIIENAIHMLKERNEEIAKIKIYIGPSIRVCCYEVGEEFLEYFNQKYFTRRGEKLYFDMIKVAKDILVNTWVLIQNIEINKSCTHCSWKFFSYRNNKNKQRFVVAVEKNNNNFISKWVEEKWM